MSAYWDTVHALMVTVPYAEAVDAYRTLRDNADEKITVDYLEKHQRLTQRALVGAVTELYVPPSHGGPVRGRPYDEETDGKYGDDYGGDYGDEYEDETDYEETEISFDLDYEDAE